MMMQAVIRQTDMPGLYDLEIEDGRVLRDLTSGQVRSIAARELLTITPAR